MNVFVLNAGSSSTKAAYFEGRGAAEFTREPDWAAEIRWTELPARAELKWTARSASASTSGSIGSGSKGGADGGSISSGSRAVDIDEHGGAARALLTSAIDTFGIAPDVVGHRIVHGLSESHCTLIDARVRALIEQAEELAPLHNRAALAGIDAVHAALPGVVQAADFDTAFHTTLPPAVAAYALPYDWFVSRGIRRYGFHGISHRYCARRTAEVLEHEPAELRMVSAHLGNGCSLAAVVGGKSVDTTMGFTPLEGLMMGSRSGSVDPGLLLYLITSGAHSAAELDTILNTESGLKGVSQRSEDIRDVIAAAAGGAQPAQLALDMYVHRLSTGIAAMAAAAGGIDALAFTGGVGEHSAYVRDRVCARLAFLGVALVGPSDVAPANGAPHPTDVDREISAPGSAVRVTVVRAREEYAIARDIALLLARAPKVATKSQN